MGNSSKKEPLPNYIHEYETTLIAYLPKDLLNIIVIDYLNISCCNKCEYIKEKIINKGSLKYENLLTDIRVRLMYSDSTKMINVNYRRFKNSMVIFEQYYDINLDYFVYVLCHNRFHYLYINYGHFNYEEITNKTHRTKLVNCPDKYNFVSPTNILGFIDEMEFIFEKFCNYLIKLN